MARYTLPQYQSVYRDPGSVQVNTILRDRFANAIVADDALAASVDGMNSANYEGDNQLKNELAEEYNAKLEERSRRGDYETAGMSITKDSRNFIRGYQPIKQNFDRVQAYQAKIKAEYEKGDLNAESYKNMMAMSNKNYTGLQKNDNGSINDNSYFSGYGTVKDIDFSSALTEAMKGYAARTGGSEVQLVGQGKDQQYMIKTGSEWSQVPPEDVEAIFQDVLADPNIAASLRQQADVRTYNLTDEQISTAIGNSLYGNSENENSQGLIAEYNKLIASGKTDKKTVAMMSDLENEIEERESLLGEAGIESSEELINKRRNYMKNDVISQEINRERGAAYAKYVRNNVTTSYIEDYDKKRLIDYKIGKENYISDIQVNRGQTQIKNVGGDNIESITSYIDDEGKKLQNVAITATEDAIDAGHLEKGDPPITLDQIMSGDLPEGISDDVKEAYKNDAIAIQTQIAIQENLLKQAREETGTTATDIGDKYLDSTVGSSAQFGEITGQDVLDTARDLTGNPNLTIEGLLDLYSKGRKLKVDLYTDVTLKELTPDEQVLFNFVGNMQKNIQSMDINLRDFDNGLLKRNKNYSNILNEYLKTNSTREAGGQASPVIVGSNTEESQKNSKIVKDTFEKKPLPADFKIYYNGQKQNGTGNLVSLIEDLGWEGTDVIVTDVMFDTSPFMGEPTTAFTVKGMKDGKPVYETITVPYTNFKQSGLDRFFNTPDYRQASEVNLARQSGLDGTTIEYSNGVTLFYNFKQGGKSSQDLITYTYKEKSTGKSISKTITPTETIEINGEKVNYLSLIINEAANKNLTYKTVKNDLD